MPRDNKGPNLGKQTGSLNIPADSVEQFEEAFARYTGASYAAGVASGTAALELACKAAGIKRDDEVIVPANSFFATGTRHMPTDDGFLYVDDRFIWLKRSLTGKPS